MLIAVGRDADRRRGRRELGSGDAGVACRSERGVAIGLDDELCIPSEARDLAAVEISPRSDPSRLGALERLSLLAPAFTHRLVILGLTAA